VEESSGKNSAGREEEESRSRWCEGISIARFTRLTCDAAARAGERAEKKELSLLYFRQRATMAENDMFLHVIEAKLDPAHARRPAYSSHIK
jgi:hypothetical protein